MNRRFVHVVVNHFSGRPCPYTLHSINASNFFYPTRPNRSADTMEDDLLPHPAMSFHHPCSPPEYDGGMDFMSLGCSGKDIVGVDQEGRTILYDTASHAVRTMPTMRVPKCFPMSIAVSNSLYVMDSRPGPPESHTFEALIHGRSPSSYFQDWYWRSLPPPPYVHDPGYENDEPPGYGYEVDQPYDICAYTVVGDSEIWISTAGVGTYCFDTANDVWSKPGEWPLPFSGRAEYVREHNLWFGLSSQGNQFCTSDFTTRGPPVLRNMWELDPSPPQEWIPTKSYLVPLGFGKFCIVKLYETSEEPGYERFAVFTGVEVERSAVGSGLRMIKHKSKRYRFEEKMVDQVL